MIRKATWCVCFVFLIGCGGSDNDRNRPQDQSEAIQGVIAATAEKSTSASPAKAQFVTVPPAAELKRYTQFTYEMADKPKVQGDTATVNVKVMTPEGETAGTVSWELKKIDEVWKLQAAPLP